MYLVRYDTLLNGPLWLVIHDETNEIGWTQRRPRAFRFKTVNDAEAAVDRAGAGRVVQAPQPDPDFDPEYQATTRTF